MKKIRFANLLMLSSLMISITVISCGGGSQEYSREGLMSGDSQTALFTRGSQQYLRGSLTAAKETFNTLIYRYPDSPLRSDAQLAVRRIESDLNGTSMISVVNDTVSRVPFPSVAIVGLPSVQGTVSKLESLILATGTPPITIEDQGAPDVTLVLYPQGYMEQANLVADSLAGWLSSHTSVPVQPGGDIIASVAPDHPGVVIVVGSDATVEPSRVIQQPLATDQPPSGIL